MVSLVRIRIRIMASKYAVYFFEGSPIRLI